MSKLAFILPYFNEKAWIGQTIDSLVAQSERDFQLILVDNGSTDMGVETARLHARALGNAATFLAEATPGKTAAIAAGLQTVGTPYVAICDADTVYPSDYACRIIDLFESNPEATAVMAIGIYEAAGTVASDKRIRKILHKAGRHPAKCHAGGYAQAFRTDILRRSGGFDIARWPYVLEDHEVVHRTMRYGAAVYSAQHVCFPSARRSCRKAVSWTPIERLFYKFIPARFLGWYFYSFLGPRLERRKCHASNLRSKPWEEPPSVDQPFGSNKLESP